MNQIDLYFGLASLALIALGFLTGFLRSALSVIWVYICIYISSSIGPAIISAFSFLSVEESQLGKVIMIFALFVVAYAIGELILAMLKNIISVSILGPMDKVLGAAAAVFKCLLIIGFVFEVFLTLPQSEENLRVINSSILKEWGTGVFKTTYPMAVAMGGRAQLAIAGQPAEINIDARIVTAEAGKIVETVRKITPPLTIN